MNKILDIINNKKIYNNPPVWIMRQAGRYLPEYREIRRDVGGFLDLCYNPKLASEITLQPIKRFDFDAAIIFSDILVIPHALGVKVDFVKNEGPVLEKITNIKDLKKLKIDNVINKLSPIFENVNITRSKLSDEKALIGFSGSPFTLACYMIEGGSSKNFELTRKIAIENEDFFIKLIEILSEAIIIYLNKKIEAGADIIKLFDSCASILPEEQFMKFVVKPTKKIIERIKEKNPNTPIISFPRGCGSLYENFVKDVNCDVLAIDQNISSEFVVNILQNKYSKIIQGNLDNYILAYGSKNDIEKSTRKILEKFNNKPFIFNLGHGIIKDTPIENVEFLLKIIRQN